MYYNSEYYFIKPATNLSPATFAAALDVSEVLNSRNMRQQIPVLTIVVHATLH